MILSLMNETLINPVNDTGIDVDALLFCKLLSYAYLSNAQTPLCIRHGITLASELECHSWSPLTRQHNNLESHKSMAKKIMKMSGMQLIPTFYPVIAAQAILFKIVLSYPTADFHFMNFLMNLNLYGNGCIKVFRDSIFRLRGISDKFVFLDGFNAEEMVSSFVFAETFPFPLCPNDEEGMTIAKKVMLKRWSGGKTILEQHRCNEDTVLGSYNDRVVTCMFGEKAHIYAGLIDQVVPHFSGMHPEIWVSSSKRHCKTIGDNNNIIDVLLKMCFMFSFAKANPVFPVHILCNPIMCLKDLSEEYGINVKEMLKTPHEFNGNQLEYLRKTFYDNIPNIRSVLPDGKERKMKSYYFMKDYGLTEAGYGYVGELLKFSQPASKEIRDMMAENRKNTIEVKSRYEKELENQQMSANLIARIANMTYAQKEREYQQRSARSTAGHATRNANMTDVQKELKSQRHRASGKAAHANRTKEQRTASGKAGHATRDANMTDASKADEQKELKYRQRSERAKAGHATRREREKKWKRKV